MNRFYLQLKENLGLSLILFIGLGVEFSNFQAMFFRFMSLYRPDWGAFNHIPAIFLSAFLLLCIVIFGIRRQTTLSWFLALLTCVISFSVYSRMKLSWEWENMHEIHFVVLILSGMLPMLVAYTTHQIARSEETEYYGTAEQEKLEGFIREIRQLQMHKQQRQQTDKQPHYQAHTHANTQAHANTHTNYAREQDLHHANTVHFDKDEIYGKRKVSYEVNQMIRPEKKLDEKEEIQHCEECNASLQGKKKGTKYCSRECSLSAQKRRRNTEQNSQSVEKEVVINGKKETETALQKPNKISNAALQNQNTKSNDFLQQAWTGIFENEAHLNFEVKKVNQDILKNENVGHTALDLNFSCDYCGKETTKQNKHSRYCSEICQITALKSKQKSGFYVQQDEFDTAGFIEWKNPAISA
jgi:hypothetical protein